jgi:hypothetical protein
MNEKDIWFVRSNGGQGSYPINSRGWNVVYIFLFEAALFVALALWIRSTVAEPEWLWIAILAIGLGSAGMGFILIARSKTDFSITYDEYMRRKRGLKP